MQKGIDFLNNQCGIVHGNICLKSVFADAALQWSGSWLVWSTLMPSLMVLLPSLPSWQSTTHQRWSREEHTMHSSGEMAVRPSGKQCTGLVYVRLYMYLFGRSANMWGLGILMNL